MSQCGAAAPPSPQSPSWFIASSDLTTLGEKRAQETRVRTALQSLQQVFPTCTEARLRSAIACGGDLGAVVNRLLEQQVDSAMPDQGGPSSPPARAAAVEQMKLDEDVDARLSEEMASSGLGDPSVPGSARASQLNDDDTSLTTAIGEISAENLAAQSVAQLSNGTLKISARVTRTFNELEDRGLMLGDKIVTKFVINVEQLGFKWEVARRYSEFCKFHDLLSLQWTDLPSLPPKFLFVQECTDIAARMLDLDGYLRELLASPAIALCPLLCAFLDAIDAQSFRSQTLPRLQQMQRESRRTPP
ncbi:hypothetical protein AB1Y20_017402 [Prymnesium parvum]|uniref:PX domain-containing protein n=1 Tax=Prymnesium parvum TaxID=97485 RepID=A0AB34JNV5_PRYPA|mmetsp:Transcript_29429/g.73571  ORF Transcript_29429/g.73571 Transcript_29429/m.73571 type:complete len:303 (+) Transcript_29429:30-938(+)